MSDSEDLVHYFKADGQPVTLSANDSREAKFLIQNISVECGS